MCEREATRVIRLPSLVPILLKQILPLFFPKCSSPPAKGNFSQTYRNCGRKLVRTEQPAASKGVIMNVKMGEFDMSVRKNADEWYLIKIWFLMHKQIFRTWWNKEVWRVCKINWSLRNRATHCLLASDGLIEKLLQKTWKEIFDIWRTQLMLQRLTASIIKTNNLSILTFERFRAIDHKALVD